MALFDINRSTQEMRLLANEKVQKYFTRCDYIETRLHCVRNKSG